MPASAAARPSPTTSDTATTGRERALDDDALVESVLGETFCNFSDALILRTTDNDELVPWLLSADITPGSPALDEGAVEVRTFSTSIKVFKRYLFPAEHDEGAAQDSVIGRACYEDWLSTRSRIPAEPEKTFQRILTSTVSGTDGRQPFTPEQETTVLKQLRVKRAWPAFADTGLTIGIKGFRGCVLLTC